VRTVNYITGMSRIGRGWVPRRLAIVFAPEFITSIQETSSIQIVDCLVVGKSPVKLKYQTLNSFFFRNFGYDYQLYVTIGSNTIFGKVFTSVVVGVIL